MLAEEHRLTRIFNRDSGKAVIVPIDDSLINGPYAGLENLSIKLAEISAGKPTALLGFSAQFEHGRREILGLGWIHNLTASTIRNLHTRKSQIQTVKSAILMGCDVVAAHVNLTSKYEGEMIQTLGRIIEEARSHGIPVLAIMYPRREDADCRDDNHLDLKRDDQPAYAALVAHCARVARDLGASIVKTVYSGSRDSFKEVIAAADPIPVVIAGGPLVNKLESLSVAADAIAAGARGISFGRNVFSQSNSTHYLQALNGVVHENLSATEAIRRLPVLALERSRG